MGKLTTFKISTLALIGIVFQSALLTKIPPYMKLFLQVSVNILASFNLIYLNQVFLGQVYIVVHIGGLAVLFLFALKMAEGRISGVQVPNRQLVYNKLDQNEDRKYLAIFFLLFLSLAVYIIYSWGYNSNSKLSYNAPISMLPMVKILTPFGNEFPIEIIYYTGIQVMGHILYLAYPVLIVIISILLWVVLIGILRISKT